MGEIAAPPAPAVSRFALAGSARAAALMLTATLLFAVMNATPRRSAPVIRRSSSSASAISSRWRRSAC